MVNFEQAIKWLREGKKIRRPCWNLSSFWRLGIDESIEWEEGEAIVHLNQIEADDWEIYEERIKCFWCERYVVDLVEHTNKIHTELSPRSYDFLKGGRN